MLITFKYIYLTYKWDPKNITTSEKSGTGSNVNEEVLYTTQISSTGASPPDAI